MYDGNPSLDGRGRKYESYDIIRALTNSSPQADEGLRDGSMPSSPNPPKTINRLAEEVIASLSDGNCIHLDRQQPWVGKIYKNQSKMSLFMEYVHIIHVSGLQ